MEKIFIYERLRKVFDERVALEIAGAIEEAVGFYEKMVTKDEFNELKAVVRELAEAQKRTEARVEELAEAQKKTEERLAILEEKVAELAEAQKRTEQRVNELAEAQKRTEQRVNELAEAQRKTEQRVNELAEAQRKTEQRVNELAEAQKRTEQRVNELAEAQKRTEQRVNELAEAQRKTEEELRTLVKEHKRTREILMGLSDTIGYGLEDKVIPYIKEFAKMEYYIEVDIVDRRNIIYPDGRFDEINIYAEGRRNGEKIYLIGECKSKPNKKDIDKLLMKAKRIENYLKSKVEVFLVGYYYSPNVEEYLRERSDKIRYFKSFDFGFKYK